MKRLSDISHLWFRDIEMALDRDTRSLNIIIVIIYQNGETVLQFISQTQ